MNNEQIEIIIDKGLFDTTQYIQADWISEEIRNQTSQTNANEVGVRLIFPTDRHALEAICPPRGIDGKVKLITLLSRISESLGEPRGGNYDSRFTYCSNNKEVVSLRLEKKKQHN
jgi:hypothetical protein